MSTATALKNKPRTMQLTARDRAVVYAVFLHRFMTAKQIQLAVDSAWHYTNISNRLKLLFENKYLDRPQAQFGEFVEGGGRRPTVYALGNKGAYLLMEEPYNIPQSNVNMTNKNNTVDRPHIKHTLLTTEIVVQAQDACRQNGLIFRDESALIREISRPERSGVSKHGTRGWSVPESGEFLPKTGRINPDRMFALEFPHLPAGSNRLYFFLEADRGTESQISKDFKRPTIARKMRQYRVTAKTRLLQEHFPPIKNYVVLFVSTKEKRAINMFENNKQIDDGWKNFWFSHEEHIAEMPFFSIPWQEGRSGNAQTLEDVIKSILVKTQ